MISLDRAKKVANKNKKLRFYIIVYTNFLGIKEKATILAEAEVYAIGTLVNALGDKYLSNMVSITELTQKQYYNRKSIFYY